MTAIIPGSKAIGDIKQTVEFLKLVTTAEGLQKILSDLEAQQKSIEDGRAELTAAHDEVFALRQSAQKKMDEANILHGQATKLNNEAEQKAKDADARLLRAEQNEAALERKRREFDEHVRDVNGKLTDREVAVAKREGEAHELLEQAKSAKAQYEGKLAEFRNLAK